ncbi:trihelix transcription factor GTL2-like [Prosopis cineraria]|uniref:trihelix transcription factor GTL2-like n=1 Tax=Prosopis cineraria TaxID=364024 RepID=UPI0024102B3A|nr:trihelix transcription factor GTL2-like [Prosopis cineraria]
MFDGVPDQFHQFIAPGTSSLPLHLSFPLNASLTPNTNTFPTFDPFHLPLQQPNLLHSLHHLPPPPAHKHQQDKQDDSMSRVSMNLEIERERQLPELIDSCWTHDEVLALFRIRSSIKTCLPDLTWEHVSRKLAELGFKRSAEKCRDKFEEESRYLNHINYNENYRFICEFEQELYHQDPEALVGTEEKSTQQLQKPREGQDKTSGHALEESSTGHDTSAPTITKRCVVEKSKHRKRKKQDGKFEMFKGFCENIVSRMMAQQEEMHNKLLEDMLRRDEEKFAREEAWKKQELDRMNKELEMMAHEQALAGNRQATVIEFLKKFTASSPRVTSVSDPKTSHSQNLHFSVEISKENDPETPPSSTMTPPNHQDIITASAALPITCPSAVAAVAKNPSSSQAQETSEVAQNPSCVDSVSTCKASSTGLSSEKGDVGRRWPRDEVLALINLRCSLNNNSEDKEGNKAPLWERISQGMSDLGYRRSAKRCKEKWENINKYFRKTKDINKKRTRDSRTCPYFHLLATLYSQGKLVPDQSELLRPASQMVSPPSPPQIPPQPQAQPSHQVIHVDEGENTAMQCT